MHPNYKPVENPALLPVVKRRPHLLSADFDGDSPMKLRSPYTASIQRLVSVFEPAIRMLLIAYRKLVMSPAFIAAVNKERHARRAKNKRRRRMSKANRKK